MEKRKYEDIQIIEVFHESKRQKICAYKSLIKENCFEGTQVFEYDEAGNLLKRTVIQNHSGSGQLRECCFAYDEEKRIIAIEYIHMKQMAMNISLKKGKHFVKNILYIAKALRD